MRDSATSFRSVRDRTAHGSSDTSSTSGVHTIRGTGVSPRHPRGTCGGADLGAAVRHGGRPVAAGCRPRILAIIPTPEGVRFLTGYDYVPGWGWLGRLCDPFLIRPFVWWLTARSFDRLRMWAEEGTSPGASQRMAVAAPADIGRVRGTVDRDLPAAPGARSWTTHRDRSRRSHDDVDRYLRARARRRFRPGSTRSSSVASGSASRPGTAASDAAR